MIATTNIKITPDILALCTEIDEFKGTWHALGQLAPEYLNALKHTATVESVGSSTRIEGAKLNDQEVEKILSNMEIRKFETRDEQEVAGYAIAMNIICQNYNYIPLTENYIQQLHKELLQYSEKDHWHLSKYKTLPNHVEAFDNDGNSIGIIFETASPFETPIKMSELVTWTAQAYLDKNIHPLLITAIFIVLFLAIHPFQDGNGRLSRVLTTYLLLRSGYTYVPYSSLETIIEQNKEGYYLSLRRTQGTLKTNNCNWDPWLLFFLQTLRKQKKQLEKKVNQIKTTLSQVPELSLKILELTKSMGRVHIRDIVHNTNANRNTIKKHLRAMVAAKHIQKHGLGRGSWYTLM